jgi:hypothetical protein
VHPESFTRERSQKINKEEEEEEEKGEIFKHVDKNKWS